MAALRTDARTQYEGDEVAGAAFHHNVRDLRSKNTATGIADDIVEKTLRTVVAAVLVVDEAVGMIAVSLGDEAAGGTEIVVAPCTQFKLVGQVDMGRVPEPAKLLHHKEAAIEPETRFKKNRGMHAGWVK